MARWFPGERISKIHGQPKRVGRRLIVPMYHPAAALHQQSLRATIEDDFGKLPRILAEAEAARRAEGSADEPPAAQMSLF
jgi:DNA polymerase